MPRTVAILGLVCGIAAAPAAWAQDALVWPPPPPPRPPESPVDENDFGWQIILADLAGLASTIALAGWTGSEASVLPYLLAAPTVHAFHDDVVGAGGSLLLNAGVPTSLGYLGYRLASQDSNDGNVRGNTIGFLGVAIGIAIAAGVDVACLSHPARSASKPAIQVTPAVDPNRLFSLVVTGRF
jgi:hypothetical protein